MSRKIYDCITFYNSNLLFKLRFETLKNYVDFFVVCEANKDHVGREKRYNFDQDFYKKNINKIIYIQVNDLPQIVLKGKKDYKLVKIQMENLFRGIKDANDEDLILFSDEDEILNPKIFKSFEHDKYRFGIFLQNMYYYKLNIQNLNEGLGNWPGTRVCKRKYLKSFFKMRLLKVKNVNYPFWRFDKERSIQILNNGGWHFSYLMTPDEISNKIRSMAHTEFNKEEFNNVDNIILKIKNLKDPFDRNFCLKIVELDNSFPEHIKQNINLYKDWVAS